MLVNDSSEIVIATRESLPESLWDDFVVGCDGAWLWHLGKSIRATSLWPGKRDLSFAVLLQNRIIGLMPLLLVERTVGGWYTVRRLESIGGPCFCTDGGLLKTIQSRVQSELVRLERRFQTWETHCFLSALTPNLGLGHFPLADLGFSDTSTGTWVVDLRRDEDTIFQSYSKTTRYEIRKLINSVHIREAQGTQDLEIYYDLHRKTYGRSGLPPHPKFYFEKIFSEFVPRHLARVLFLERNGTTIAAQNTALFKNRAFYWTGASDDSRLGGETKLLCHLQILHAKKIGCELYEMGEASPEGMGKSKTLSDFKRSLGGVLYPFYRGRRYSRNPLKRYIAMNYHARQRHSHGHGARA